jgi:hypothetical protein
MYWTDCPDCGLPAKVTDRAALASTDGPVEHARVCCIDRHRFLMPVTAAEMGLEAPPDEE